MVTRPRRPVFEEHPVATATKPGGRKCPRCGADPVGDIVRRWRKQTRGSTAHTRRDRRGRALMHPRRLNAVPSRRRAGEVVADASG
jgi:hypothetical protein